MSSNVGRGRGRLGNEANEIHGLAGIVSEELNIVYYSLHQSTAIAVYHCTLGDK